MKNIQCKSILPSLLLIPLCVLSALGLTILLYYLIYTLLESAFYPNDPLSFPAGLVRTGYAIVLVILYLVLYRTKAPELLKAILLASPVAAVIITTVFKFYDQPAVFIPIMLVIPAVCAFILYRAHKPWVYYYSLAISSLVAIWYAWPRI